MSSKEEGKKLTVGEKFLSPILIVVILLVFLICGYILLLLGIISLVISLPIDLLLAIIALIISFNKFDYPKFGRFPITKVFWRPFDWTAERARYFFT